MIQRGVIALTTAAAVVLLSAGCGKPSGKAKSEVRLAHIYEPMGEATHVACCAWLEKIKKQFEAATTATVRLEQVQWDKIDAKMMNDYRSGIEHDVTMSSPQLMPQHFEVGSLLDLTPFLKHWPQSEIDDFSWAPSWRKCARGDVRLAVPTGAHARVVIYRKDYFKEAGLDPEKPPATLDELIEAAKKLTRDTDGDGKIDVWGLGFYAGPQRATIELYFAPLLWHFGGALFDAETKQATFASEAGKAAAEWIRDCIHVHKITPPTATSGKYDDVIYRKFMDGNLAMAWGWGNYFNEPLEEVGWTQGLFPPTPEGKSDRVGVFVTPTRDGAQFTNCWALSIHKLGKNPALAFDLFETILSPENLAAYPDAGLPARRSAWGKPEYQTDWYKTWRAAVESGRSMPDTPHYNDLADSVRAALQEIITRKADPAATLKRYQDEFNRRYAKP